MTGVESLHYSEDLAVVERLENHPMFSLVALATVGGSDAGTALSRAAVAVAVWKVFLTAVFVQSSGIVREFAWSVRSSIRSARTCSPARPW